MTGEIFKIPDESVSKIDETYGENIDFLVREGSRKLWKENRYLYRFVRKVQCAVPHANNYRASVAIGYLMVTENLRPGKIPVIMPEELKTYIEVINNNITDSRWIDQDWQNLSINRLKKGEKPSSSFSWFLHVLSDTSPKFCDFFAEASLSFNSLQEKQSFARGMFDSTIPFYIKGKYYSSS